MNIKTLGITVFSTLILAACGGSSESDNTSAENRSDEIPEQSIISNLEWGEYSFDHASPTTLNIIKKSLMTITSRSLYRKFEYTTVGTVPENYPWLFETEALTEDGLYQLPETASQQGYHYGVDLDISENGTVWTFTPYSNLHLKRLKFTTDYDVINLSHKPVSYYLDTYLHLRESYIQSLGYSPAPSHLKNVQGLIFPEGAFCLRKKTVSTTQPVIKINYYLPIWTSHTPDEYFPEGYTTNNLANFLVHVSDQSHQNSRTAMFSTGTEYAYGDYYESADTVYNVEDKIMELQKLLQEYPEDKDIKWEIEKLKNQCTLFNKTASTYIDSAQKLK